MNAPTASRFQAQRPYRRVPEQRRWASTLLRMQSSHLIILLGLVTGCSAPHTPRAASLTSERAHSLAVVLANRESHAQFGVQPFSSSAAPILSDGIWHWSERRSYGQGDLEADVSFAADGASPLVRLVILNSAALH